MQCCRTHCMCIKTPDRGRFIQKFHMTPSLHTNTTVFHIFIQQNAQKNQYQTICRIYTYISNCYSFIKFSLIHSGNFNKKNSNAK